MANLTITNTFVASTSAQAAQVNTNFTDVKTWLNNRDNATDYWLNMKVLATGANPAEIKSSNADCEFDIDSTGSNGTPRLSWRRSGTTYFTAGVDGAASNLFKFGTTALTTNVAFAIPTTGVQVQFADGTVSLPSISFINNTNMGLYRIGANSFGLASGGVVQMTVENGDIVINDTGAGLVWNRSGYDNYAWEQAGIGFKLRNTTDSRDEITTDGNGGIGIHGTVTNNNATAGFYGETVSSAVAATNFPASTIIGDLTSVSLTAGDWLVAASASITTAGTVTTGMFIGISTTSGNSVTGLTDGDTQISVNVPASGSVGGTALPYVRLSLSGSVTAYFKYSATYSGTTPRAAGRITAVRIR